MSPVIPSSLATWLLRICTPGRDRSLVIDDLREEFHQRLAAGHDPARVRRWFWQQALGSCAHGLRRRFRASSFTRRGGTRFMFTNLVRDLRYAVRSLIAQPAYTVTAILMLTLGIAGNTAVFSVFNGLFLRPLPFAEPSRLVNLDETAPRWNLEFVGINYQDFVNWRDHNTTFESMAVFDQRSVNMSTDDEPLRVSAVAVSHDLAHVLNLPVVLGRHLTAEEDRPGGERVAELSYGLWQSGFGGDSDVVGRAVTLDGNPYTVIGVLPPEAAFVQDADLWIPLQADLNENQGSWWLDGIGRLKADVAVGRALDDLTRVHRNAIPDRSVNEITSPVVLPVLDRVLGDYRPGASTLLGAVALVLVIACANIAGLTLARSITRSREVAIRVSLGAGQRRVVQQLLTESLVLSAAGAALGTVAGVLAASGLRAATADLLPVWVRFSFDSRVLAFVLTLTLGAALAFGLMPALRAARAEPGSVLHGTTGRASGSRQQHRALDVLIVSEVALSLVLLVSAGLAVRDLQILNGVDPGFIATNLLTYRISLPETTYPEPEDRVGFFEDHLSRLEGVPGIEHVSAVSLRPLGGHTGWFFEIEGAPQPDPDAPRPVTLVKEASAGYFETMRIPILRGRAFEASDGRDAGTRVVVVNETFARNNWPDDDPIGRRIRTGDQSDWLTVVGVAQDVKHYGVDTEMRQSVYWPYPYNPRSAMNVMIRTTVDPQSIAAPVRRTLAESDPDLPMADLTTMSRELEESLWPRRAASWLAALFSVVALSLAVGGIYGVVSYTVNQRSREIGIRMALGAQPSQVVGRIVRHGVTMVGAGVLAGAAGAFGVERLLANQLVGVKRLDPLILGTVIVVLLLVTSVANLLPARRAATIPPADVLRQE